MGKLQNIFSWSVSRDRLFTECRRAYYYHYYGAWGGWERDAPELAKKTYLLKNMHSIDTWVGDVVHQTIKWVLENKAAGKDIAQDAARARIKEHLVRTWAQSKERQWVNGIKQHLNLFEHYYKREPSPELLAMKIAKAVKSIDNFYKLKILDIFSGVEGGGFLSIDELDSFDLDGVKVYAVPDFAVKEGRYILFDWKTGKPSEKDLFQLSFYVLYAQYRWRAAIDEVEVIPVYLSDSNCGLQPASVVDLSYVRQYVQDSAKKMREVLTNVEANQADIARCPKTQFVKKCANCRFQEICV
jgi:CRISPR/Cas system-associated exonuclease Cas4 (RecB family)